MRGGGNNEAEIVQKTTEETAIDVVSDPSDATTGELIAILYDFTFRRPSPRCQLVTMGLEPRLQVKLAIH
jgi:hypothetical protein